MTDQKIWTWDQAKEQIAQFRTAGKKMVFTNGCFDILHAGHVHYLEAASQLGDGLLVALNTDESVQRLEKSPARPLQSSNSRSRVMAALGFVTGVVLFNEDTPKEIIEYITPHILVKGADYAIENIVGADWVLQHDGEVKTLEFVPGYSTTQIEKKILAAHGLK
ncbi:MAG: adenylyltransferase/cytidyltransferase family protein [Bacteroidota bacterium]|jgi:rfaE bifunctional protein nucleotidyltransferase chain/domain|nr:adenylyltransferase/cytidyltransferase family protein [Bacteroidota bacterium]